MKHCLWMTKMVTHSKIVEPLYTKICHFIYLNIMFLINVKLLTFKHFRKYIFNNVLMNLSFMDFLFHVPFFCTAVMTEILAVCF
jgi:hypothetical protein